MGEQSMLRVGQKLIPFPEDYPVNWPVPGPGQTFGDVVAAIPRMEAAYDELAHAQVVDFLERGVPGWLDADDARHSSDVLLELCRLYPGSSPLELLWTLAADAFRPALQGRPAVWSKHEGRELYELVEAGLSAMNLKRNSKKGLRAVIAVLRSNHPTRYGCYSEERLRQAYYDARAAQSGKARS